MMIGCGFFFASRAHHLYSRQYSTFHAGVHHPGTPVQKVGDVALVRPQFVPEEGGFRSQVARHAQGQDGGLIYDCLKREREGKGRAWGGGGG